MQLFKILKIKDYNLIQASALKLCIIIWITIYFYTSVTKCRLPVKKDGKKRNYRKIRQAYNNTKGTSISERPEFVDARDEIGHWEMDVVGKQGTKTVLMVLSERVTRKESIFKIPSKSAGCC